MATGTGVGSWPAVLIALGSLVGCASSKPATTPTTHSTARGTETPRKAHPAPEKLASVHQPGRWDAGETEARPNDEQAIRAMRHAISLYEQFIERAQGDPDMQQAVARSRERIEELRQTIAVVESWR